MNLRAQSQPAAPASPSAPPFWARPKPTQQSVVCEDPSQATPLSDSDPGMVTGLVAGVALTLLVVVARRGLRKAPAPAPRAAAAATPAPTHAPPPAEPDLPAGFDPRSRRIAAPAAKKEALETPPVPLPDFAFADPATAPIELAQQEPAAGSDRATAFYTEVAASLLEALHREPTRQDLRLKLLEIHYVRKHVTEFVTLAHEYLARNRGFRDKAWREIHAMGVRLAPDHVLFGGGAPKEVPRPVRRVHQMRRFHERDVDAGRIYEAQQALTSDFERLREDASFDAALRELLDDVVRRPSPLSASAELAHAVDGARLYIKHEDRRRFHDDLLINVYGQVLLAQRLGRKRVVTATRDGNLGQAVASAAARLGLECLVYITERDLNRYYARVLSLRRLGAILRPIPGTPEDQPDPRRAALEAWLSDPASTQYVSGLTGGPDPYPHMVRQFLSLIGRETAEQMTELTGGLPRAVVATASDGHLALGLFLGLIEHAGVQLYCVEPRVPAAKPVADEPLPDGELPPARQLLRREHRWLRATERVAYVEGEEHETLRLVEQFHSTGTTLYTDSARALAQARVLARRLDPKESVVVLLTNQDGADFRSAAAEW